MPSAVRFASLLLWLALVVFAGPAQAQGSPTSPEQAARFVHEFGGRIVTVLARTETPDTQLRREIETLIFENIDVEAIGRSSLGASWQRASEAQRAEYLALFAVWATRTYADRLGVNRGGSLTVLGALATASDAYVRARVAKADGRASLLDLRVREIQGRLKIVDAEVDGISMDQMQREEFASVVRRQGLDALIASLRTQVGGN